MGSCRATLFQKRHFAAEIIVTCVRWYLRFSLSLRDVEELMAEGKRSFCTGKRIEEHLKMAREHVQAMGEPDGDSLEPRRRRAQEMMRPDGVSTTALRAWRPSQT